MCSLQMISRVDQTLQDAALDITFKKAFNKWFQIFESTVLQVLMY